MRRAFARREIVYERSHKKFLPKPKIADAFDELALALATRQDDSLLSFACIAAFVCVSCSVTRLSTALARLTEALMSCFSLSTDFGDVLTDVIA